MIKSIQIDVFFQNQYVKMCEIVESLKYFDKKRLTFAKGAQGANENPAKSHLHK